MKKGIKKAATVVAAIALLSACGTNPQIMTDPDLGQSDFERISHEHFVDEDTTHLADHICEALEERGMEGYQSFLSAVTHGADEKLDMIQMAQAAVNWKCPQFATK